MIKPCPHCGTSNQPQARFCQNCGKTMAALPGSQTVVMPPSQNTLSPSQQQAVMQRTRQAYGVGPMCLMPGTPTRALQEQREQTNFVIDVSISMNGRYNDEETKLDAAKRANVNLVV